MRVIAPITEDEMVLAFLRGEVDSSSFSGTPLTILGSRQPIDEPDRGSAAENALRREALAYRGYGHNAALFAGFPTDVNWQTVALTHSELDEVRYLSYETWRQLSKGSRLVKDGAANVEHVRVADNANTITRPLRATSGEAGSTLQSSSLVSARKIHSSSWKAASGRPRCTGRYRRTRNLLRLLASRRA